MSWENKVVWTEGLFLQPQHLQQQERYFERLIRHSTAGLRPFSWGLTQFEVDSDLLTLGKFAVRRLAGVLPDGTPFSIPDDVDHPTPFDIPEATRNAVISIVLPARQPGSVETAPPELVETIARFATAELETIDTNAGYQGSAVVPIGKLRLRYALEGTWSGHVTIGLARIIEVRSDRSVLLDDNYIPPVLSSGASTVLASFLTRVHGLLHNRAEALAGRMSETGVRGAAEISDYLLLQLCNRFEPLFAHLEAIMRNLHPETFYQVAVSLAGELATFVAGGRRPPAFPAYKHEDLQATFAPVMAALREYLSMELPGMAVPIALQIRKFGIRVGPIADRALVTDATWVLAVKAQIPGDTLRRTFPNLVKIGPVEQIRELITVALPGIPVRALPVAPRQLPYYSGTTYFELDRSGPYWAALARSAGIAIHVTEPPPGLEIECWAIRG
jgi:type VI secretion system protein ImpJ